MQLKAILITLAFTASAAYAIEAKMPKKPTTPVPTPVPTTESTPAPAAGMMDHAKAVGTQATEKALVNINTAPAADLEKVPGLTPATAKEIVANRPYVSVTDLSKVKGLKSDVIAKIKPYVTTK